MLANKAREWWVTEFSMYSSFVMFTSTWLLKQHPFDLTAAWPIEPTIILCFYNHVYITPLQYSWFPSSSCCCCYCCCCCLCLKLLLYFSGEKPTDNEVHKQHESSPWLESDIVYEDPINSCIGSVHTYDYPHPLATSTLKKLNICQTQPDTSGSLQKGEDFTMNINKAYGAMPLHALWCIYMYNICGVFLLLCDPMATHFLNTHHGKIIYFEGMDLCIILNTYFIMSAALGLGHHSSLITTCIILWNCHAGI